MCAQFTTIVCRLRSLPTPSTSHLMLLIKTSRVRAASSLVDLLLRRLRRLPRLPCTEVTMTIGLHQSVPSGFVSGRTSPRRRSHAHPHRLEATRIAANRQSIVAWRSRAAWNIILQKRRTILPRMVCQDSCPPCNKARRLHLRMSPSGLRGKWISTRSTMTAAKTRRRYLTHLLGLALLPVK